MTGNTKLESFMYSNAILFVGVNLLERLQNLTALGWVVWVVDIRMGIFQITKQILYSR